MMLPGADTATVYRFLEQLSAADVPLISVTKAQPSLEEIFIRLIRHGDTPTGATYTVGTPGTAAHGGAA